MPLVEEGAVKACVQFVSMLTWHFHALANSRNTHLTLKMTAHQDCVYSVYAYLNACCVSLAAWKCQPEGRVCNEEFGVCRAINKTGRI